jgi:hypothetical protein
MFDGIEDLLPRSAKCFGGFFPGKVAGPASEEEHVSLGEGPFAVAPRNFFHDDGVAAAAVYAPHGVEEEDEEAPEGNELETPLGELIVTGCRPVAARAKCRRSLARAYGDLDALWLKWAC